jgi:hypothetical protein
LHFRLSRQVDLRPLDVRSLQDRGDTIAMLAVAVATAGPAVAQSLFSPAPMATD